MNTLISPPFAAGFWPTMPRSVAVAALAAALSACGGGSTDLAADEPLADASIAQNTIEAGTGTDTDTRADTNASEDIETSPDIEIDPATPLEKVAHRSSVIDGRSAQPKCNDERQR